MVGRAILAMPRFAMSTKKTRHLHDGYCQAIILLLSVRYTYTMAKVVSDAVRFNALVVMAGFQC